MTQIRDIPTGELVADLAATEADMLLCEIALKVGVTQYDSDKSVKYRIGINRQTAAKIRAELDRRALT